MFGTSIYKNAALGITTCLLLIGCAPQTEDPSAATPVEDPQAAFLAQFAAYCGQSFEGTVVHDDSQDELWQQRLIMHIRDCAADEVRIPLHLGNDRSRTWVVSETDTGLSLQHIHLHEDGTADAVSPYGGHTVAAGSATRQAFPVDEASKTLFGQHDLLASQQNTWTLSFVDENTFSYALSRPGRLFEVQFDLTQPVATPPAAWGYKENHEAD